MGKCPGIVYNYLYGHHFIFVAFCSPLAYFVCRTFIFKDVPVLMLRGKPDRARSPSHPTTFHFEPHRLESSLSTIWVNPWIRPNIEPMYLRIDAN